MDIHGHRQSIIKFKKLPVFYGEPTLELYYYGTEMRVIGGLIQRYLDFVFISISARVTCVIEQNWT